MLCPIIPHWSWAVTRFFSLIAWLLYGLAKLWISRGIEMVWNDAVQNHTACKKKINIKSSLWCTIFVRRLLFFLLFFIDLSMVRMPYKNIGPKCPLPVLFNSHLHSVRQLTSNHIVMPLNLSKQVSRLFKWPTNFWHGPVVYNNRKQINLWNWKDFIKIKKKNI